MLTKFVKTDLAPKNTGKHLAKVIINWVFKNIMTHLISVVEAIIHEPSDEWSFSHWNTSQRQNKEHIIQSYATVEYIFYQDHGILLITGANSMRENI